MPSQSDSSPDPSPLSKREREIMDILYRIGESSVSDVTSEMSDELSPNSIRTFLTILENKGHLTRRKQGREFFYQPADGRDQAGRSALKRVLDVFFDGSLQSAVACHLEGDEAPSEDEISRLQSLIDASRDKDLS